MSRLFPAIAGILATLVLTVASPQLSPTQPALETISGSVVSSNTAQALPQTRVELVREDYARRPTGYEKACKPQPDSELTTGRRFVSTDVAGRFTFDNIVPGRYYLIAEREGYLKTEYGQQGWFPIGTVLAIGIQTEPVARNPDSAQRELGLLDSDIPLITTATGRGNPEGGLGRQAQGLAAGADSAISQVPGGTPKNLLQDLKISMIPSPTIAGKVAQEKGPSLAAAAVQAYAFRYTPLNGRTLRSIRATLTNDEGLYRLFWLNPGRYVVAAGYSTYGLQPWTSGLTFTPNLPSPDSGLPTSFYAVSSTAVDAQVVRLNPGTEPFADLQLRDRRRLTASVQLVGQNLPPSPALVFVPQGGDLCAALDYAVAAGKDGKFEIRDVPEGVYVAAAMNGRDFISDLITVKVENGQTNETLLPVVAPTDIWGTVYLEGVPPGVTSANMRVNITRARQEMSQVATGKVEPLVPSMGSFSIPGMGPGTYYVSMDLPPGFYVDNIGASKPEPNGPDICALDPAVWSPRYSYMDLHGHLNPTDPFVIPGVIPNAAPCLAIRVRFGLPIYGFVYSRLGKAVPGAFVVAIPKGVWAKTDDAGVTPPDRYLTATTDSTGYFEMHGATDWAYALKDQSGQVRQEYHIYAFENIDPNLIYAPDFSDRFRNREAFVIRTEERQSTASPWGARRIQQATTVYSYSCPGLVLLTLRQYCVFTSIPPEDTAEIQ
jgi:hypothetical protein